MPVFRHDQSSGFGFRFRETVFRIVVANQCVRVFGLRQIFSR